MADATDSIGEAPANIGKGLGHKLGPLPVWVWIVGGVVIVAGVYYVWSNRSGSSGLGVASFIPTDAGNNGAGVSDTTGSNTPAAPLYATNADWLTAAVNSVTASLGITAAEAQMYLQEYLNGTSPVGSSQASGTFNNVVQAALTALGNPPQAVTSSTVNNSPFNSNTSWLNDILAFLPTGTPASVANEITNWVNGGTTQLSAAAANALGSAQAIVGNMPNPLSYSLLQVTSADVQNWVTKYESGPQTYANWVASLPTALNALSQSQLTTLYNYFQAAHQQFSSPDAVASFLNGIIANPSLINQLPNIPPPTAPATIAPNPNAVAIKK